MGSIGVLPHGQIVGALACQKDSYLQKLDTEVISCTKYAPPVSTQNGKAKTKKSKEGAQVESKGVEELWEIECADSVLFPEGGGQPTDHGTLALLDSDSSAPINISFIQRQGLRCVKLSPQPIPVGTLVRQTINHTRRWDHMQQHTGQHLLSAIMEQEPFNLPTLGWGMGAAGEMNYIELPQKPSPSMIADIQARCTEVIRDNLPVTVETPEDATAPKLPGDYDKDKGVVRIIKIGELDSNPCCGTHLRQTSHVSLILLHHTQSIRGTNTRLFFSCGDRAISLATAALHGLRSISEVFSCGAGAEEVLGKVQRQREQVSDLQKREKRMLAEIASHEAGRIKIILHNGHGKKAYCHRPNEGREFLDMVVFELKDILKETTGVAVLSSGEGKAGGAIIVVGNAELVAEMAAEIKSIVSNAKGGGKGEKWQGKVTEWRKGELDALEAFLRSG